MNLHDEYWSTLAAGEFKIRRCKDCGTWQFPPMTLCQHCLSENVAWERPSGRGRVWSWIRVHKPYFKSFSDQVPYLVAMIELDEGPMMISSLLDVSETDVVPCGAPVELAIKARGDKTLPYFRLSNRT
ncbi:MAG: OB-fold domain-containing protein [Burkholderiales bacterium]|mgnify:CR=1 FL=1|nr:OB-fold domain-containing protein [Burkholderiales bacterium]ODU68899.1 MAG: hypothetical protein ABT05_02500 [Lautropia sp. SCN 66-9]